MWIERGEGKHRRAGGFAKNRHESRTEHTETEETAAADMARRAGLVAKGRRDAAQAGRGLRLAIEEWQKMEWRQWRPPSEHTHTHIHAMT